MSMAMEGHRAGGEHGRTGGALTLVVVGGADHLRSGQLCNPSHVPSLGHFPLIISPIIRHTHLSRVLMDGGSGLNILYTDALD